MKLLQAIGAAAMCWLGTCAFAASIAVPNFSFEEPDVTEGTTSAVSGWTSILIGGGGTPVVRDPVNAQYPGSTGNNAALPGSALGGQSAYFQFRENGTAMTTTLSGTTVQPNTLYLLTVAVGNPLDQQPGSVLLRLTVNGNVAVTNTILATDIPDGTFTDFSVALGPLASTDSKIGGTLGIELRNAGPASFPLYGADFDNVRLTTAVPEPSSALWIFGSAALTLRSRRKR